MYEVCVRISHQTRRLHCIGNIMYWIQVELFALFLIKSVQLVAYFRARETSPIDRSPARLRRALTPSPPAHFRRLGILLTRTSVPTNFRINSDIGRKGWRVVGDTSRPATSTIHMTSFCGLCQNYAFRNCTQLTHILSFLLLTNP
jgi:hypothetical protein